MSEAYKLIPAFRLGKYRTRSGPEAVVVEIDETNRDYPLVGHVIRKNRHGGPGYESASWDSNGHYFAKSTHEYDLVLFLGDEPLVIEKAVPSVVPMNKWKSLRIKELLDHAKRITDENIGGDGLSDEAKREICKFVDEATLLLTE